MEWEGSLTPRKRRTELTAELVLMTPASAHCPSPHCREVLCGSLLSCLTLVKTRRPGTSILCTLMACEGHGCLPRQEEPDRQCLATLLSHMARVCVLLTSLTGVQEAHRAKAGAGRPVLRPPRPQAALSSRNAFLSASLLPHCTWGAAHGASPSRADGSTVCGFLILCGERARWCR